MSVIRTKARKERPSALAGPFSDATNTLGDGISVPLEIPSAKPVSRRVARQRTKHRRAIATTDESKENDFILPKPPLNYSTKHSSALEAPLLTHVAEPTSLPAMNDVRRASISAAVPYRIPPTLIVRSLPAPPPKRFYGPFEACSRADVLFDPEDYMPRTFEEDAWGICYVAGEFAVSISGPIRVITLQAPPGMPGSVQLFYG